MLKVFKSFNFSQKFTAITHLCKGLGMKPVVPQNMVLWVREMRNFATGLLHREE